MSQAERQRMVVEDMEGVQLGDRRLEYRARKAVGALAIEPALGFPQAVVTEAALEGLYRFLSNKKVTRKKLLEPHAQATVERLAEQGTGLVLHDNTGFRFGGQGRQGLGKRGGTGSDLMAHFCLALRADGSREPLGVLDVDTWIRTGESPTQRRKANPNAYRKLRKRKSEQDRWFEMVERTAQRIGEKASVVHVMDSEADDYILFSQLLHGGHRFTARLCFDRRLDADASGSLPKEKMREFLRRTRFIAVRDVKLSRRKRAIAGGRTRRIAPRKERTATLGFSAIAIVLRRPTLVSEQEAPPSLTVNIVSVRERNAPRGLVPVDWLLISSEPIDTEEQILKIVDTYRARWMIEEYFKSLKTGCAFESRQLETRNTIENALALFIPVAWTLLRMRTLSRAQRPSPITAVFSLIQIKILRARTGRRLRKDSSVRDGFLAVARLGGHLKSNGEPGWQVLGRGYDKLLTLESGFKVAKNASSDQ